MKNISIIFGLLIIAYGLLFCSKRGTVVSYKDYPKSFEIDVDGIGYSGVFTLRDSMEVDSIKYEIDPASSDSGYVSLWICHFNPDTTEERSSACQILFEVYSEQLSGFDYYISGLIWTYGIKSSSYFVIYMYDTDFETYLDPIKAKVIIYYH